MYKFVVGIDEKEHDNFVKGHELCNLLQSANWAKVKDNWDHEIVGVYDENNQLVASSLVLIKHLPFSLTMMYTPRGPIMDYQNKELVQFFMSELKKFAKKQHCLFIKMDPGIHYNDYPINEPNNNHYDVSVELDNLKAAGCIHQGYAETIAEVIQPRHQANVYYDENLLDNLPKHTKRLMKDAIKHNVEFKVVGKEGLKDFSDVVALTEERKQVNLRNAEYFEHLMDIYGDDCLLVLGEVDVKKSLDELYERKKANDEELKNTDANSRKKLTRLNDIDKSLQKSIKEFEEIQKEYPDKDKICIAGILSIAYGDTLEMLYAGMNDRFKKFMPQYYLYVKTFEYAFDHGLKFANMGGVEGDLKDGLSKFKSNFNPMINEFIGEFDLPINKPLYKLASTAYKIRKKRHAEVKE